MRRNENEIKLRKRRARGQRRQGLSMGELARMMEVVDLRIRVVHEEFLPISTCDWVSDLLIY